MKLVAEQGELSLRRDPVRVAVPIEMVRAKKNQGAAFSLACEASGLDDKEIYISLDIDGGTFSRLRSGKNTLSNDQIVRFCEIVGNTIYPEWIAYQLGCTMVVIKTEAERRADAAEERALKAEEKAHLLTEILAGRIAA